uniref:(California timema) hypothetical protein n=1 Tax=Timema californicum TaxID=61474 RepID=A0A7R9JEV1_TIMCA|nr:unnamed protein product [Timema californicum]
MDKRREKKSKFTEDIENEPNQFVCSALFKRQSGFNIPGRVLVKLEEAAEDSLISEQRNFKESKCELPGICRSTFLMVYSPDGTKVASTHGNHNVYVTDLKTGKNLNTLSGHPRTPWCIAFHPTSNQILATGCLGGQVRVWDLHGGSEVWVTKGHTVIASLAFHPTDRMLVIATYNELHFWDWSEATPFTKCYTANEKEKVRYVSFDSLGHKLITGISNAPPNHTQWDRLVAPTPHHTHLPYRNTHRFSGPERETDRRSISGCYRSLVDQYEMLVQRYSELSRSLPAATVRTFILKRLYEYLYFEPRAELVSLKLEIKIESL